MREEERVSTVALTPTLKSIEDLFGKLEREAYRAYHAEKEIHQADHFYNFCMTAHSMKDHFFERKQIIKHPEKNPYYDKWKEDEFLVAAFEIANTTKHFTLREPKSREPKELKTQKVEPTNSWFVNVYVGQDGLSEKFVQKPDLIITLETEEEFELYQFTSHVIEYWATFLRSESINVREQPVSELLP